MRLNFKMPHSSEPELRIAVRHSIRLTLVVAGCFFAIQPGLADTSTDRGTTDLAPINATHPPYVPPYTPPSPPSGPRDFGSNPGDPSDGGGGSSWESDEKTCENLNLTKPPMCPNPIHMPTGAFYARDEIPGAGLLAKSTIRMAMAFAEGRAHGLNGPAQTNPTAAYIMDLALYNQTEDFTNPGVSLIESNKKFRIGLESACTLQMINGNQNHRNPGIPTVPEKFCFEIMRAFDSETTDGRNFASKFVEWTKLYGIPLSEYIPPALVDSASLENSIAAKYRVVTRDSTCSRWWTAYEQNQCNVR